VTRRRIKALGLVLQPRWVSTGLKMPYFSGEDGEDFEDWLIEFETYAEALHWTRADVMVGLPLYLKKKAARYMADLPQSSKSSAEQMKEALRKRFTPRPSCALESLFVSQRRNESVRQFWFRIEDQKRQTFGRKEVDEETLKSIFLAGLQPQLQDWVRNNLKEDASLTETVEQAEKVESNLSRKVK
jgi:hypothetical protein